jgi:hypothetical protein
LNQRSGGQFPCHCRSASIHWTNDGRFYVLELQTGKKLDDAERHSPLPGFSGRADSHWPREAVVLFWVSRIIPRSRANPDVNYSGNSARTGSGSQKLAAYPGRRYHHNGCSIGQPSRGVSRHGSSERRGEGVNHAATNIGRKLSPVRKCRVDTWQIISPS